MSDTGYPLKDALVSLAAQLENKRSDWNIRKILTWPAHNAPAVSVNTLTMEILPDSQIIQTQFGDPDEFEYQIQVRITYIGAAIVAERQYHNALDMICNVWKYLMEHPQPDSYGTVKAVGNMGIGNIESAAGDTVSQAAVDISLHIVKTIAEA